MATLVLGAVGAIIGGPAGFAIGSAIGQRVDQRLLAPKRRGPRLGDLSVQASTYGAPLPRLFGRMRVAGSVIWSTDLVETRSKRSNGKGQPKTTVYSYSASFAVALSARPIVSVGRIWADGKLLRGAGGDFKTETGFRLHLGGDDQPVDPLIAAAEGAGNAPAYRGLAYAMFEDFQLADYGNRIPSLSFEVIADAAPVRVGAILRDLSGGAVIDDAAATLAGFAATGDGVRDVAAALAQALPLSVRDDGAALRINDSPGIDRTIPSIATGATAEGEKAGRIQFERRSSADAPRKLAIGYSEIERDYQVGVQAARRAGEGRREFGIELPAALTALDAKAIAEARLSTLHAARRRAKCSLSWRYLDIGPGDRAIIEGETGMWRVASASFARGAVEIELEGVADAPPTTIADPGRNIAESDLAEGPTTLIVLDLPPLGEDRASAPVAAVAAAGSSAGWRRAALLSSIDGGTSWQDAGRTAAPAIIGYATSVLGHGPANLIDKTGSVDVTLLNAAMQLADADMIALLRGSNIAMLGAEAIQFGRAMPLGGGVWRLADLLRGRRGTEAAIGGHTLNEPFVLLEADALMPIAPVAIGQQLRVMASGIGDLVPAEAQLGIAGRACLPLSPVHGRAAQQTDGGIAIGWTRRSRTGWAWPDGVDAPLAEEVERYRLVAMPQPGAERIYQVGGPAWTYSAAERAADIADGATALILEVRQAGDHGLSPPLTIDVPLL
jgi:hypothetical protein